MDKDAHRLARLRTLVVDAGGPAAFVRAYSQPAADKPIDPTYVSQLLNGKRVFGENPPRTWSTMWRPGSAAARNEHCVGIFIGLPSRGYFFARSDSICY